MKLTMIVAHCAEQLSEESREVPYYAERADEGDQRWEEVGREGCEGKGRSGKDAKVVRV